MPAKSTKPLDAQKPAEQLTNTAPNHGEAPGNLMQIDPAVLNNLLEANRDMMARLEALTVESNMLKSIAGKSAIKDFQERSKDFTIKRAHLKTIGGKVVVGWHKGTQDVFQNDAGHWVENVTIVVEFEDGTEATIRYIDFVREQGMKQYVIRARTDDAIDGMIFTLDDSDGRSIRVKEAFLNP